MLEPVLRGDDQGAIRGCGAEAGRSLGLWEVRVNGLGMGCDETRKPGPILILFLG